MNHRLIPHLGIMQGRLLPKYLGRYQAHPVGYWQDEFPVAASLGLDYIEFILDYNDAWQNPLLTDDGAADIRAVSEASGVGVRSVCADYFMEAPLHAADQEVAAESRRVLERLIGRAGELGISDIVIPCVDQSTLGGDDAMKRLAEALEATRKSWEGRGVNMALETDLNPERFSRLLDMLPYRHVTVNYDTGNSASLGYDVQEEFAAYGHRISDIHIKDRVLGGGSVQLGAGNTRFDRFFDALEGIDFHGIFVMQVYRDDEGVEVFRQQLDWLKQYLNNRS